MPKITPKLLANTFITELEPTGNHGFAGAPSGQVLGVVGGHAANQARTLLEFDLTEVPQNAAVVDATLSLWMALTTGAQTDSATLFVHEVKQPWVETGASWTGYNLSPLGGTALVWHVTGASGSNDIVGTIETTTGSVSSHSVGALSSGSRVDFGNLENFISSNAGRRASMIISSDQNFTGFFRSSRNQTTTEAPLLTLSVAFSGDVPDYGDGLYGRYGYTPTPIGSLSANPVRRGSLDGQFYWSPTHPFQYELPTGASSTGLGQLATGDLEVTSIESYQVGISPDLGWPNVTDLFKEYSPSDPFLTNSQLHLEKDLSVDKGTLTFVENTNLLKANISESTMDSVLRPGFDKYMWAVRALDKYGNYSRWSFVQAFQGIREAPSRLISVDLLDNKSRYRTVTLRGSKSASISAIEVNEDTGFTRYPTRLSWEHDIVLSTGVNSFSIRGFPRAGRPTDYLKTWVELPTGTTSSHHLFNIFDDYGSVYGVDRLTSLYESNSEYKTRIKDVFIHPAGSSLEGLHYSIARNLNLTYDDEAMIIQPAFLASNSGERSDAYYPGMTLIIDTNYAAVAAPGFRVYSEHHVVDPQSISITLNEPLYLTELDDDSPLTIDSPLGTTLHRNDYSVDKDNNSVTFNKDEMKYGDVWVSYSREYRTSIGTGVTISYLETALGDITHDGRPLVTGNQSAAYPTGSSDGLLRQRIPLSSTTRWIDSKGNRKFGNRVRWTDVSLHELMDSQFQERYKNEYGHLLNTKIESFVEIFKKKAHFDWERSVTDKDMWDPVDETTETASRFDNLWDPIKGFWKSSRFLDQKKYTTTQAIDLGFVSEIDKSELVYMGIPVDEFKSGIGRDQDLKVVIKEGLHKEELTPPNIYRETVSFSVTGQVNEATYFPQTLFGGLLFEP